MRHAKSDWSTGHGDFDRPLNDRGIEAADRMASWLIDEQLCPERVISSPAARTRATAMAVVASCGTDRSQLDFEDDAYLADAFTWLQILARYSGGQPEGRMLICGHNPGLDDLVDHLSASPVPLTDSGKLMTTAAVAHFRFDTSWSELSHRSCELVQLVRPRELGT